MNLTEFERHWLAGLFEGEASFLRPAPSSPRCPVVRLQMCDRDVVERAARLIGRAAYEAAARHPGHRPTFITNIKGRPAVDLMLVLAPLLSEVRRTQVVRSLERLPTIVLPASDWHPSPHWLAGLLEGEGTFMAKSRTSWITISIEMCDRESVVRAAAMLGAKSVTRGPDRSARGWRPTYRAKISGNRARPWLVELRPLMGSRRQAAVDAALDSWSPLRLPRAPSACSVAGCVRPHRSRGLCHAHYMRWSRYRRSGRDPGFKSLR